VRNNGDLQADDIAENAMRMAKGHFVYIVRCKDGSLYTGYAHDPHARLQLHNNGRGAKYTRGRLPVRLVYSEACASLSDALRREYELKQWPRARKQALIRKKQ
jgi:putative endonuclease